jgi:group II intron reverse transcriptase/maturase
MRENREARRSPVGVDDAPPRWIAGWQVGAATGREGKAMSREPEMHDRRESDGCVVPAKLANKAERSAAELVEGRRLDEGNTGQQNALRTQSREGCASSALERVRRVARKDRNARFTALLHHVSVDRLYAAYRALSPRAAAGVDEVTWESYGQELEANLQDLHARVQRGAYRAKPSRRVYIPKADGRLRPLGIAALEDKIVQRATVEVLNAIYEADFLGFSYGFRPGRGPHDALDALVVGIERKKVNWVLDADFRDFFTSLDHSWLVKFLEHRIADKRILRLIQKWLKAGVIEDGAWSASEEGSPQGATISPLLANVYLHYVFDLWAQQWRKRYARGDVLIVRYADDVVLGFQHRSDAGRFQGDLAQRLAKFRLGLNAEKTRLVPLRAVRRPTAQGAGPRPAGDVPVLGLHALLRDDQGRALPAAAKDDLETNGGEATRGQSLADATTSLAPGSTGTLARERGARSSRLLRRARQHPPSRGLPSRGRTTLVRGAPPPRPAPPPQLATDAPLCGAMAPSRPHHPSLARPAIQRSHPSQEPSALAAHAGICAGGRPQGRSLPR